MSARTVPVRSLADQVDGLERRFQWLMGGGRRPSPQPARRVERVVFVVGIEGAPLRYRAQLPAEALTLVGVSADVVHYRDPRVDALAVVADVVVMYRVPATVQVVALQDRLRAAGTPLFFDVDDLIFDPALAVEIPALRILPADQAELWLQGVHRYRTTMEGCDAFIGSTEALVAHASAVTGLPSFRFSNGVGAQVAKLSRDALARPRSPGGPRIGYLSGTDTHDQDWAHVEPAVIASLDAHPDAELVLVGPIRTTLALDRFGPRVRRLPFQPWTDLPAHLRDLDVNLAPLEPELRFNQAKSALKWLEAALARVPTIASPTGPFQEAIDPGVNGLLADTTDEWAAALNQLLTSDVDRLRLGRRAERDALLRWSPHLQGRRYLDILTSPLPHRSTSGGWVPVVLDEPPLPQAVQLTPYLLASSANEQRAAAGTGPHRVPSLFTRGVALLRRGMRSVREEGITRTAGRSFRFAQRRLGRRQAPH